MKPEGEPIGSNNPYPTVRSALSHEVSWNTYEPSGQPSDYTFKSDLLRIVDAPGETPEQIMGRLVVYMSDCRADYLTALESAESETTAVEEQLKETDKLWRGEMQEIIEKLLELQRNVFERYGDKWQAVLENYKYMGYVISLETDPKGISDKLNQVTDEAELLRLLLEVIAHYFNMLKQEVVTLRDKGLNIVEEDI